MHTSDVTDHSPGDTLVAPTISTFGNGPVPHAGEARSLEGLQRFWGELGRDTCRFDLYYTLRRIEAAHPELPLLGRAARPADEPLRIGQEPSLAFAPAALAGLEPAHDGVPPRLIIHGFGLFGPNGPLPQHLTEYARDRLRNFGDATFVRFVDILHQRLILLFYRAWAQQQSVVSLDRAGDDNFSRYVASLIGVGSVTQRHRDAVPDHAKFANTGHFVRLTRNVEGLKFALEGFFRVPVRIAEFCCHWLKLDPAERTRLGHEGPSSALGSGAIAGKAVWDGQSKFRLDLGPMRLAEYEQFLPIGTRFAALVAWVRNYAGIEFTWEGRIVLRSDDVPKARLGAASRLGWTTWIGIRRTKADAGDLVLDCERWAKRVGPMLGASPINP
jgi:type VI secretion system protein ImpH